MYIVGSYDPEAPNNILLYYVWRHNRHNLVHEYAVLIGIRITKSIPADYYLYQAIYRQSYNTLPFIGAI